MLSRLATYTLLGIEAKPVEVEVDISPGALPKTILVGLAEAAVKESTHRIERALANSGYKRPMDADERLLNCICSSLAQSLSLLLSHPQMESEEKSLTGQAIRVTLAHSRPKAPTKPEDKLDALTREVQLLRLNQQAGF